MNAVVRIVAVIGTALTIALTTSAISAASSDPLAGETYKDASAKVSGWGAVAEIGTIFGDQLATNECTVATSQKTRREIDSHSKTVYLVNLYCDDAVAKAGTPGNSVASPAGKVAEKNIKTAAWCSKTAQADNNNCAKFCSAHDGMCTANF